MNNILMQGQQELTYVQELLQNSVQVVPSQKQTCLYLKRCPYCGSSLNDEYNDLQQRFRLHCHICQTD